MVCDNVVISEVADKISYLAIYLMNAVKDVPYRLFVSGERRIEEVVPKTFKKGWSTFHDL